LIEGSLHTLKYNNFEDSLYLSIMKTRFLILLLLSVFVVSGCSEIRKRRAKRKQVQVQPFLFRTNYFLSEDHHSFSFPLWFNDSLVAERKIQTIVHTWYSQSMDEGIDGSISKVRKYTFDKNGRLLEVQQKRFYENFVVENLSFRYNVEKDHLGFAEFVYTDSLYPKKEMKHRAYKKDEYTKAYAVYEDLETGDFLFCLLDKRFQGIVSVDSLFSPTPDDIIQYGSPEKPIKLYQIENLVEENKVTRYSYFKGTSQVQTCVADNYPFLKKTDFLMNKKGELTGFIDSTFSADEYLNRTLSTFAYNEDELPSKLIHKGMRAGNFETFTYTFFE